MDIFSKLKFVTPMFEKDRQQASNHNPRLIFTALHNLLSTANINIEKHLNSNILGAKKAKKQSPPASFECIV